MSTTALALRLADEIRRDGAIGIDRFMALALGDAQSGYYRTRDPFGQAGDFVTAPEISQIFGELIGLWCAQVWQDLGAPPLLHLVELGPGRGTMMADLLRAARVLPGFAQAVQVHLVETSPVLRQAQARRLATLPVTWHDDLGTVPEGPAIFVANEFFDALPIRQWVRRGAAWHERRVGLDQTNRFVFVEQSAASGVDLPSDAPEGSVFETAAPAALVARHIGRHLAHHPGAALIIDYGHAESGCGDTLQAVQNHQPVPVLEMTGEADLTAHVDFAALALSLRQGGARVSEVMPQGRFLLGLGAETRARRLMQGKPDNLRDAIAKGLHRLVDPGQMGQLFKVLGAASPSLAALPGLASLDAA